MNRLNDSVVSLAEFHAPSPMKKFYCPRVTQDEYEYQMVNETEKAIKDLIRHLEENPTVYKKALSKRKQDDMENSGMFAVLKFKLLASLRGNSSDPGQVTEEELQDKLDDLKTGMLMAFNYAQAEVKQKRYYTRLAARRAKSSTNVENEDVPLKKKKLVPQAPPPPPIPPPVIPATLPLLKSKPAPLGERNPNIDNTSPCATAKPRRPLRPVDSATPLKTVHDELLSCNALKRLKVTKQSRSPGGTPIRKADTPLNMLRSRILCDTSAPNTPDRLNSSEPLTTAFLRIMEQKFRNVRSPSPTVNQSNSLPESPATPSEFSP